MVTIERFDPPQADQKSLPTSPAYRRQALAKGGEVFYWNSIKDSTFSPFEKGG